MWKLITGMRRKPGVSPEAFRDYYESTHAALAAAAIDGYAIRYRRNYVVDRRYEHSNQTTNPSPDTNPEFDAFAEVWFPTREKLYALLDHMQSTAVKEGLNTDRAAFIDPPTIQYMICEEVGDWSREDGETS